MDRRGFLRATGFGALGFGAGFVARGLAPVTAFVGSSPFAHPLVSVSGTVDTTTTLITGGSPDWIGRASIVRRSDDVLVMAYQRASAHAVNDGALHLQFSADDGATWSGQDLTLTGAAVSGFPMTPTSAAAGQDAGEPWLIVAPSGDLLCFLWRVDYNVDNDGTQMSRSSDGGLTWSTPAAVTVTGATDQTLTYLTDDGFAYNGVIYAGAREYTTGTYTACASYLVSSSDDGVTWTKVSTIMANTEGAGGNGAFEVGLTYTGSSRIVAMLRDTAHTNGYLRISTDMGATWGTLTDLNATAGIVGRPRLYQRAWLRGQANWWKDPVIIGAGFVQQTSGSSQDRRNCLWVSRDAGATWSAPIYVDTTTEDAGYGDVFYDATNDQYVTVNFDGTLLAADLKQYRVSLAGV